MDESSSSPPTISLLLRLHPAPSSPSPPREPQHQTQYPPDPTVAARCRCGKPVSFYSSNDPALESFAPGSDPAARQRLREQLAEPHAPSYGPTIEYFSPPPPPFPREPERQTQYPPGAPSTVCCSYGKLLGFAGFNDPAVCRRLSEQLSAPHAPSCGIITEYLPGSTVTNRCSCGHLESFTQGNEPAVRCRLFEQLGRPHAPSCGPQTQYPPDPAVVDRCVWGHPVSFRASDDVDPAVCRPHFEQHSAPHPPSCPVRMEHSDDEIRFLRSLLTDPKYASQVTNITAVIEMYRTGYLPAASDATGSIALWNVREVTLNEVTRHPPQEV
ncbi:hypothetical protein EJ06DRAFT_523057 [Trichodelitschia bisporula]|uniref:Uncharacterized protein n=1 Tax=Trichodelitschia bisporula TaxID=703511 RepID=A0A6G1HSN8_9PEZI|nr:hypothetical protein EJ06DRAFT_523057 [Trichodelitschia bisporula]